jgi:hypothetical protein
MPRLGSTPRSTVSWDCRMRRPQLLEHVLELPIYNRDIYDDDEDNKPAS